MPTEREILSVDLESTVAEMLPGYRDQAKRLFGVTLSMRELENSYYWPSTLPPEVNSVLLGNVWDQYTKIRLVDERIPKILNQLSVDWRIHIRTATPGDHENVRSWLSLRKVPHESLTFLKSASEKVRPDIRYYVDDDYEVDFKAAREGKFAVMIARGSNGKERYRLPEFGGRVVVATWPQVHATLNEMKRH